MEAKAEVAPIRKRPEVLEPIARARDRLHALDTRTRQLVKNQPLAVVGGVLVLGYAFGRLLARR